MHKDLIVSFFATFSRFEYALKEAGMVRAGRNNAAMPDWEAVKSLLRDDDTTHVIDAAGILLEAPPRRQVWLEEQLKWDRTGSAGARTDDVVESLKRVRNNLFHGGKWRPETYELSTRSEELVRAAHAVLDQLLELPSLRGVADHFTAYSPEKG